MPGEEKQNGPTIWRKMILASRLDVNLYEDVEADTKANRQALSVVFIASIATGIGTGISGSVLNGALWFLWGLLVGVTTSIIGWLAWAFITYWIGKTIFKGPQTEVTYGQMLRTLGFANSPGILRIFSFVPFVGGLIAFVATVWVLIAGIVAIRQALDFSTWRAIGTAFVGWLVYVLLIFLISSLFIDTGAFIQTPI
jgi:hypothetical protein